MTTFPALETALKARAEEWRLLSLADLQFWHRDEARLALIGLGLLLVVLLAVRALLVSSRGRGVGLPAMLARFRRPAVPMLRHAPLALCVAVVATVMRVLASR